MPGHQQPADDTIDVRDPRIAEAIHRYWRKNVRVMVACLTVWAMAGLGCGVLFADALNRFNLGGFPLGFWFAQQGSILVFVLLILVYGLALNRLDAEHHRELEEIHADRHEIGGNAGTGGPGPGGQPGAGERPGAGGQPRAGKQRRTGPAAGETASE